MATAERHTRIVECATTSSDAWSFPSHAVLFGPAAVLGSRSPEELGPVISQFESSLSKLLALETPNSEGLFELVDDAIVLTADPKTLASGLEAARSSLGFLSGTNGREIISTVARVSTPERTATIIRMKADGEKRLKEWIRILSFMLEQPDPVRNDELFSSPMSSPESRPSVSVDID